MIWDIIWETCLRNEYGKLFLRKRYGHFFSFFFDWCAVSIEILVKNDLLKLWKCSFWPKMTYFNQKWPKIVWCGNDVEYILLGKHLDRGLYREQCRLFSYHQFCQFSCTANYYNICEECPIKESPAHVWWNPLTLLCKKEGSSRVERMCYWEYPHQASPFRRIVFCWCVKRFVLIR